MQVLKDDFQELSFRDGIQFPSPVQVFPLAKPSHQTNMLFHIFLISLKFSFLRILRLAAYDNRLSNRYRQVFFFFLIP